MEGCSEKTERIFFFKKMLPKKLRRKECGGDETTLIRACAQIEVHTIQVSLHKQSGSSHGSLKDSSFFLNGGNNQCISTRTKNENTYIFRKMKEKEDTKKQEIREKGIEKKRRKRKRKNDGKGRRRGKKETCEQRK